MECKSNQRKTVMRVLRLLCFVLFSAINTGCSVSMSFGSEIWKTSLPSILEIDYSITKAFAEKFNASLVTDKAPFARRLLQLKNGEIDLLSGLLRNGEREQYAIFLFPPYKRKSNKYFFMRKGESHSVNTYEDLYSLKIGVQIGSTYFPRFDADSRIKKYATNSDESRFKMLLLKRIDAVLHTDVYGLYTVHRMGLQDKIEIAPYKYTEVNPVYMAVSKKSALIHYIDELERVFKDMVESGEVDRIIQGYFISKELPIPDYK